MGALFLGDFRFFRALDDARRVSENGATGRNVGNNEAGCSDRRAFANGESLKDCRLDAEKRLVADNDVARNVDARHDGDELSDSAVMPHLRARIHEDERIEAGVERHESELRDDAPLRERRVRCDARQRVAQNG